MDKKNFSVYMHTSPNGKRYIGITSRKPEYRWNGGRGYQGSLHFYNAILKYGWDNIRHDILFESLTRDEAIQNEIALIAIYETANPRKGYNITHGGEGALGVKQSAETRAKHSKTMQSKMADPMEKKKIKHCLSLAFSTDEFRKKHADAVKEACQDVERRRQISERTKGKSNPFYGKIHTPETRAILAEKSRGKCGALHPRSKPVLQFDAQGNILARFESGHMAALATGIEYSTLNTCLRGITKTSGGFRWKYEVI